MASKVKKPAVKPPSQREGFCVYLGPTIRGVISFGQIIRGNLDDAKAELWEALKKHPLIASLIVTGDYLPEARIKVKTPGNALYAVYMKLLKELVR